MIFVFNYGRRILKKPFKEALQTWHIRIIPFPTQMCVIAFTLLITMSRLASSDHQISGNWPLRYHHSPWLHKEFVEAYKSDSDCESPKMTNKCHKKYSVNTDVRFTSDRDRIALKNVTTINLISNSNGSALNKKDIPSATAATTAIDGASSPAPKLTDSLVFLNNQCLSLDGESVKSICDSSWGVPRLRLLEQYHLKYCNRYPLVSVLSYDAWQRILHSVDSYQCEQILSELEIIDNIVNQIVCEYEALLERYDCQSGFSVKWTCSDCRKVYRDWVCSMLMPFHINGVPIKPCQSFCERVEQRCPHLHPYGKGQYAGEPVFLCIDPNIPFNPSITPSIPYSESWLCYDNCHLLNSEDSFSINKDVDEANDEPTHCISNSELLYNNMMMTSTSTLAPETTPSVPLESQSPIIKQRSQFSRTSPKISSTNVSLPKTVLANRVSKDSVTFLRPTVNVINNDPDSNDAINDAINEDMLSSTPEPEARDTNNVMISSSAGYSSKKSIIRLPIIVLFILLYYCLYYNDLRRPFIQLTDRRCHRRTFFLNSLLYYRIKS